MSKKIPLKMKWLFWSYDINSLDLGKDKEYIVSQVLNYGAWDDVRWLKKTYPDDEIKKVIKNPGRGIWFEKVLNFWTTMFNIRLKKDVWEKAIFNINPRQKCPVEGTPKLRHSFRRLGCLAAGQRADGGKGKHCRKDMAMDNGTQKRIRSDFGRDNFIGFGISFLAEENKNKRN